MGGRIVDLLSGPHLATEALLPWLINGTLSDAERRKVDAHLRTCAQCRAEFAHQQELAERYLSAEPVHVVNDVEAALTRLRPRLGDEQPRRGLRHALTPIGWWRLGFAVQLGVIAMLGAALLHVVPRPPSDELATYRGMGDVTPHAAGDALVFFDPSASEGRVRSVLQRAGARIVDGPTAAGAYVVRFDTKPAATLAALRSEGAVVRVEPLTPIR